MAQQREHLAKEIDYYKKTNKSKNLLKKGFKKLKGKIQVSQKTHTHNVMHLYMKSITPYTEGWAALPFLMLCLSACGNYRAKNLIISVFSSLPPPHRVVAMCLRCLMALLLVILAAHTLSVVALAPHLVPTMGLVCLSTCRTGACPAASPSHPPTARNSLRTLKMLWNHWTGTIIILRL